ESAAADGSGGRRRRQRVAARRRFGFLVVLAVALREGRSGGERHGDARREDGSDHLPLRSPLACVVAVCVAPSASAVGRSLWMAWPRLIPGVVLVPTMAFWRSANGMCRFCDTCSAAMN